MEINLENKAKFFAQYWGQLVIFHTNSRPLMITFESLTNSVEVIDSYAAYLKPLSLITDEDSDIFRGIMHWPAKGISVAQTIVLLNDNMFPMIATDFLRLNGYAISWAGISVKEMVQAGWIKLQEA